MKKGIVLTIIILLCSGCTIIPNNKCKGDYDKKIINNSLTFQGDYEICANYKNQPIFKNNEKALSKIKTDYKDTLGVIKETFNLKSFNENNLTDYKNYSNQLIATSDDVKKSASDLSTLLEIYENGE